MNALERGEKVFERGHMKELLLDHNGDRSKKLFGAYRRCKLILHDVQSSSEGAVLREPEFLALFTYLVDDNDPTSPREFIDGVLPWLLAPMGYAESISLPTYIAESSCIPRREGNQNIQIGE